MDFFILLDQCTTESVANGLNSSTSSIPNLKTEQKAAQSFFSFTRVSFATRHT